MAKGTIKTLMKDRGFGFIQVEGGEDVFFHSSAVPPGTFDNLQIGQTLEFDIEADPRNAKRNRAANVQMGA